MGNESSTHRHDPEDEFSRFDGIETLGYRVLGVQPNSPASAAGLVSFLDFLVGCNGVMLMGSGEGLEEGDEYDDVDFPGVLRENEGKELELLVHNIKSDSQRLVKITPSSSWGGAGLLGVTIRLDNYGGADERLIRVLSVEHNSPAAIAGLVPMSDYLLGTTSASFDSDEVLAEALSMHVDRIVEIYVYSSETDLVRVVTLMPTYSWGGRGLLGAEVGTGYLHRFPKACRGTDGKSVERKIRIGVRPTEAAAAEGAQLAVDAKEEVNNETAITDEVSGQTMCFAEQMEMEPEPNETQLSGECPQVQTNKIEKFETTSEQTGGEYASEADALFSCPPPESGVFTPTSLQNPAVAVHHQFPSPPYASYSAENLQYPPQPVSPSVDLR